MIELAWSVDSRLFAPPSTLEDTSLSGVPLPLLSGPFLGLSAVLTVIFSAGFAPYLARDGSRPAADAEPETLGLVPPCLGDAAV